MPLIDAISIWLESVGEKVMSKHGNELANSSPLSRHPRMTSAQCLKTCAET